MQPTSNTPKANRTDIGSDGAPAPKRRQTLQARSERIDTSTQTAWSAIARIATPRELTYFLDSERISPPPQEYIFDRIVSSTDENVVEQLEVLISSARREVLPSSPMPEHQAMQLLDAIKAQHPFAHHLAHRGAHILGAFQYLWDNLCSETRVALGERWQEHRSAAPMLWALLHPDGIIEALEAAGVKIVPEWVYQMSWAASGADSHFWSHVTQQAPVDRSGAKNILEQHSTWSLAGLRGLVQVFPILWNAQVKLSTRTENPAFGSIVHWLASTSNHILSHTEEASLFAEWLLKCEWQASEQENSARCLLGLIAHPHRSEQKLHLLKILRPHLEAYPESAPTLLREGWYSLAELCFGGGDIDAHFWAMQIQRCTDTVEWPQLEGPRQQKCREIYHEALSEHTERALAALTLLPKDILNQLALEEVEPVHPVCQYSGVPKWLVQHDVADLSPGLQKLLLVYACPSSSKQPRDSDECWCDPIEWRGYLHRQVGSALAALCLQLLCVRDPTLEVVGQMICKASVVGAPFIIHALEQQYGLIPLYAASLLRAFEEGQADVVNLWNNRDCFYIAVDADGYPQASEPPSKAWLALTTLLVANQTQPDGTDYESLCLKCLREISNFDGAAELLLPIGESSVWRVRGPQLLPQDCAAYLQQIIKYPSLHERGIILAEALWDKASSQRAYAGAISLLCDIPHRVAQAWMAQCVRDSHIGNYALSEVRRWISGLCYTGNLTDDDLFMPCLSKLTDRFSALTISGVKGDDEAMEPAACLLMRVAPSLLLQHTELWDPEDSKVGFFIALLAAGSQQSPGTIQALSEHIKSQPWICFSHEWAPHIENILDLWDGWTTLREAGCVALLREPLCKLRAILPREILQLLFEKTMRRAEAFEALSALGMFEAIIPSYPCLLRLMQLPIADHRIIELTQAGWDRGIYSSERINLLLHSAMTGRTSPEWLSVLGVNVDEAAACPGLRAALVELSKINAVELSAKLWPLYCCLESSDWEDIWSHQVGGVLWWPQWWRCLDSDGRAQVNRHVLMLMCSNAALRNWDMVDGALIECSWAHPGLLDELMELCHHLGQDARLFNRARYINDTPITTPWLRTAFLQPPSVDWGTPPTLEAALETFDRYSDLYDANGDRDVHRQLKLFLLGPKRVLDLDANPVQSDLFERWQSELREAFKKLMGRVCATQEEESDWRPLFSNLLECVVCPAGTLSNLQDLIVEMDQAAASLRDVILAALTDVRRKIVNGHIEGLQSLNPFNSPHQTQLLLHLIGGSFLGSSATQMPDAMGEVTQILHDEDFIPMPTTVTERLTLSRELLQQALSNYSFEEAYPYLCRALTEYPSFITEYAKQQSAAADDRRVLASAHISNPALPEHWVAVPKEVWQHLRSVATQVLRLDPLLRKRLGWHRCIDGLINIVQCLQEAHSIPGRSAYKIGLAAVDILVNRHGLSPAEANTVRATLLWLHPLVPHLEHMQDDCCWQTLWACFGLPLPSRWIAAQQLDVQAATAKEHSAIAWQPTETGLREELLLVALQHLQLLHHTDTDIATEDTRQQLVHACLIGLMRRTAYLDALDKAKEFIKQVSEQRWDAASTFVVELLIQLEVCGPSMRQRLDELPFINFSDYTE